MGDKLRHDEAIPSPRVDARRRSVTRLTDLPYDQAKRLDAKYGPKGVHVYFCGVVYEKARVDFDEWLKQQGRSLFYHFRAAFTLIWPEDDHQRWSDLILKTFCENEITVLIGCSDSGKTWTMSKIALVDYWSQPDKTLWLVSTTEGRGSELRIWGAIKDLFNRGKMRYPANPSTISRPSPLILWTTKKNWLARSGAGWWSFPAKLAGWLPALPPTSASKPRVCAMPGMKSR